MRFKALTVANIGGLVDQRLELPESPVVAFAGPNGTGKTKLLAALLGFWAGDLPTPRSKTKALVTLEATLDQTDRVALDALSREMGWGEVAVPETVTLKTSQSEMAGMARSAEPAMTVVAHFPTNQPFLRSSPNLNPMYLPAERRLLAARTGGIDLAQLAEAFAFQQSEQSRAAIKNYGRLDDQEFEQFAKALCVAHSLEDDPNEEPAAPLSRIQWPEFLDTVNALLHPKKLLPLSRQHADQLRIQLPNGDVHAVPDLSSGERQALIIISRVLRAGAGHSVVIIDEPDAYLHPNLSQRLIQALQRGTGNAGQLIVATHSPAILDRIPTDSIVRLNYDTAATRVGNETGLIELYRTTGFKASALTQSELLVVTEGDSDDVVLKAMFPCLARASVQQGQGRRGVIQRVQHLLIYNIPVIGLIDRDVAPPALDPAIEPHVCVLPTADLEGAFLSDDAALQVMLDERYVKPEYRDIASIRAVRDRLYVSKRDNTIAELAQQELRNAFGVRWPSSRGDDALALLRATSNLASTPPVANVEEAITRATALWDANAATPWRLVRGKYILGEFTRTCTNWTKGSTLLEAVAGKRPKLTALQQFTEEQ
ncbi:ATP-dependent nuclease [Mycolicibacterium mucogenicum]|nr:ATP-binding protein [Mycolicibacterium mucogenicum]